MELLCTRKKVGKSDNRLKTPINKGMSNGKKNNAITVKYDHDQLSEILSAANRQKVEKSKIIRHAVDLWIEAGSPLIADQSTAFTVAESVQEYTTAADLLPRVTDAQLINELQRRLGLRKTAEHV